MLEGKKTKAGGIMLIVAGCVFMGGLYDLRLCIVGVGLAMMGMGLGYIGMHNRFSKALYHQHDGKIHYGSPRIQSQAIMGGE